MTLKNRNGLYIVPSAEEDSAASTEQKEVEVPVQEEVKPAEEKPAEDSIVSFRTKDQQLDEDTLEATKTVISNLIEKMEQKQPIAFVGTMMFEDGDNHDFCVGSTPLTNVIARLELLKVFLVNSILDAESEDEDGDDVS